MKKLISLVLICAVALSLAGCGKDAGQLVKASVENINTAESYCFVTSTSMDIGITAQGQSQNMLINVNMDGTAFSSPMRSHVIMTADTNGESTTSEVYSQETSSGHSVYTNTNGSWATQTITEEEYEKLFNSSMSLYLEGATRYAVKGTTQKDGKNLLVVTGVLSGDSIKAVMLNSGMLDGLSQQVENSEELINNMLKDLGDLKLELWIDEEAMLPVRMSIDMSEMFRKLYDNLLGAMASLVTLDIRKCETTIEYSQINSAPDFSIPQEALTPAV